MSVWYCLLFLLALSVGVSSKPRGLPSRRHTSLSARSSADDTIYTFDQLIDHNNPSLGTFQQRYYCNDAYYQSDGPVVYMSGGENDIDGMYSFTDGDSILYGAIAEEYNGLVVMLEHRFFGYSVPLGNLTESNLQYLTLEQAIADLAYFAQNVQLPITNGSQEVIGPYVKPWVLVGDSYSGDLAIWTKYTYPGLFAAAYGSSAPVEAIGDFYNYFTPIQEFMPSNCSSDVEAVVGYINAVFASGNETATMAILNLFGLGDLRTDDFADALRSCIQEWSDSEFVSFCDSLEVSSNGTIAGPGGFGLAHALEAWANFWINDYYPYACGTASVTDCLDSYNPELSLFTVTDIEDNLNGYRAWQWLSCANFGFYENAPPIQEPSLILQVLQPVYGERLCTYLFPETYSSPPTPNTTSVNAAYGGWNIRINHSIFTAGERDPWRYATVLSPLHLLLVNTSTQVSLLHDGYHTGEIYLENADNDPTIAFVQSFILSKIGQWLSGWSPRS